jgi:regulator of sigma E protease
LDFCLIAAAELPLIWVILAVAVALGMVIFVHELGHFLVAKACGVKCEKFYLGFDIYGLKICKFRWGETEYGIGILPLGGYVKMLGQEDNPARLREEIERAKQKGDEAGAAEEEKDEPAGKIDVAAAEQALYNPRSYLAKSVPQRMAIISAGVIMNVIFAFICAVVAYRLGVKQMAATIGSLVPGDSAWQVGLRPGDEFREVNGKEVSRFKDVMINVSLGDHADDGVPIVVYRPGDGTLHEYRPIPVKKNIKPTIGILSGYTTTLAGRTRVTLPDSAAARAEPEFKDGDEVVAIDGRKVGSYGEIHACLAANRDKRMEITVRRKPDGKAEDETAEKTQSVTIVVPPNPMRQLVAGLEMAIGPIAAIREGSPAADAGLRAGDVLENYTVAGQQHAVGDPMTLPDRLYTLAQQAQQKDRTIELTVLRDGERVTLKGIELRPVTWFEQPVLEDTPLSIPELGIAYYVESRVAKVATKSSAAAAGLEADDVVVAAAVLPSEDEVGSGKKSDQPEIEVEFDDKEQRNWPSFIFAMQHVALGSRVELTLQDGRKLSLEPTVVPDRFNPDRGLLFAPKQFTEIAETWNEALRLGTRETWESLSMVVMVLKKIGTGKVSAKGLGGPGTIAVVMGSAARDGLAELLIIICVISANLAVLNILPIPLLDGGHMVFLAWEGLTRKPASERVQLLLTYLGLVFILTLMVWVIGLDILRLLRYLGLKVGFLRGA